MEVTELSEQEKRIAHYVAKGFIAKEIAGKLYISVLTVRTHLQNIRRKIGAKNIADITRMYILSLPKASDVLKTVLFLVIQINIMANCPDMDLRRPTRSQVRTSKTLRKDAK